MVCERCKHHKNCKDYQTYLIKRKKEVKILNEANKNIPMFPVSSSNILSLGYNANTRTLRVEFKKNVYYDYFKVPPETFQQLMSAPSKGKFFHAAIKQKYDAEKVII